MNKIKLKNILLLMRRDFNSHKKLFLGNIIFYLILFVVFFYIEYSYRYLFPVFSLGVGLGILILIGSILLISEEKGVFKTLKCLPVKNKEIYISKLLIVFFNEVCFLIIPMIIFILFSDLNNKLKKFIDIKIFYIYLLFLFLIIFFFSILIFILSLIKRNASSYFSHIVVISSVAINTVPFFKNSKIMKSNFAEIAGMMVRLANTFLYLSVLIFVLLLPLIYFGYRFFNKKIYSLCEK